MTLGLCNRCKKLAYPAPREVQCTTYRVLKNTRRVARRYEYWCEACVAHHLHWDPLERCFTLTEFDPNGDHRTHRNDYTLTGR